jgi:hypothetical protein
MTALKGPLTPPLHRKQGPQGVQTNVNTARPETKTSSMPMRPMGGTPRGFPSATPRPKK